MRSASWRDSVTRYQWLVLFVAWLGWVFDSMDSTIYALVLQPALHDLLRAPGGGPATAEVIGWYGGIIFSIFLSRSMLLRMVVKFVSIPPSQRLET